jgi:hypothetical protein
MIPPGDEARIVGFREPNRSAEMARRKGASGTAFQIAFERSRLGRVIEIVEAEDAPGSVFGGVAGLPCIMRSESGGHIFAQAGMLLIGLADASKDLDVIHALPRDRPAVAEAMAGSLR